MSRAVLASNKWSLPANDGKICKSIAEGYGWEPDVGDAIRKYANPDWTFLDLGAHVGWFTRLAIPLFKHVIAVEPTPNFYHLVQNCPEAECHNVAVTDRDGEVEMLFVEPNTGMSWVTRPPSKKWGGYVPPKKEGTTPVPSRSLESILGDRRPEFIKADIEGCEYLAFKDNDVLEHAQVIVTEWCTSQLERSSGATGQMYYDLLSGFDLFRMDGTPESMKTLPTGGYTNIIGLRR